MKLPTCQELLEFLSAYLADELPSASRAEFDRHLSLCVECRNYLENFRSTLASARAACQLPSPEDLPEELVEIILRSRPTPP